MPTPTQPPAADSLPPALPDPRERFSNRADSYVRGRPTYPPALVETLRYRFGLTPDHTIADIGCGTGILAQMFLSNGNAVIGIEPNAAMRTAAQQAIGDHPAFQLVAGSAEQTTLPPASVDWISAAQAFHWFDVAQFARESRRVLRSPGRVVVVWNNRRLESPAMHAYQALIDCFETHTVHVTHDVDKELPRLREFFSAGFERLKLPNVFSYDLDQLLALAHSSSYLPAAGQPRFEEMNAALRDLFGVHAAAGQLRFEFDTHAFIGQLV